MYSDGISYTALSSVMLYLGPQYVLYNGGIVYIRMFEVVVYRILRYVERYCLLSVHDILDQIPYPNAGYSDSTYMS